MISSEKFKAENGFISSKEIHGSYRQIKIKNTNGNLTYYNIIL